MRPVLLVLFLLGCVCLFAAGWIANDFAQHVMTPDMGAGRE